MFSVIRLEVKVNFFIGKFLEVLFSLVLLLLKQKILKGDFWEVSFLILCFQLLGIMTRFRVGNEIWMKKSCEVSNYGKLSAMVGYCKNRDY